MEEEGIEERVEGAVVNVLKGSLTGRSGGGGLRELLGRRGEGVEGAVVNVLKGSV